MHTSLPAGELEYLSTSNPYLLHLVQNYQSLECGCHSMWETWRGRIDLANFRREGDYLSQLEYGMSERKYWATFGYVAALDDRGYLSLFAEDDLFGVIHFPIGGRMITRDLLDSILEINFLSSHLGFAPADRLKLMDIGAGYGRFAHRFHGRVHRAIRGGLHRRLGRHNRRRSLPSTSGQRQAKQQERDNSEIA